MNRREYKLLLSNGLLWVTLLAGCSEQKPWETTQPAVGTITLKGRPIANAELAFFPEDDNIPTAVRPRAKSTEGGKFIVWTYAQGDGAPAGSYKVTVVHHEVGVSKGTIIAKLNDLPKKYSKLQTTDIVVNIAAGQNEIPPIELR